MGVQEHLKQDSRDNETANGQRVPANGVGNVVDSDMRGTRIPLLHENHKLTLGDLKEIGREVREILSDALARHPASSGAHLYLPRTMGRRGMKSLKQTYREVKIKSTIHLHNFDDPAMKASAKADIARMKKGRRLILKKLDSM